MKEPEQTPRAQYKQRLLQRQTVIFGSLAAGMGVILIFAMLFWTGALAFPWDREFSAAPDPNQLVVPCVAEGTHAVDLTTITVNVYNSTTSAGLAATAAGQFATLGVAVGQTDNWNGDALSETARIRTGVDGIAAAYTIAQYIPNSVVQFDNSMTGETLTVILGTEFTQVSTAEEVAAAHPDGILTSQEGCQNIEPTSGTD